MNIVIPMAGLGSRFSKAGFKKSKPFIDVAGKPMIVRVLENLACEGARYFCIARKEQLEEERDLVRELCRSFNVEFIPIAELTEGTVCTVLYAEKYINNDENLLIANSDQLVEFKVSDFCKACLQGGFDGSLLCFEDASRNPKWSFVKTKNERVVEVREKEAISDRATVGIYFWTRGKDFIEAARTMIAANDRVNNEFYTAPVYNYAIKKGAKIGYFDVEKAGMHGLGTPEDLACFLSSNSALLKPRFDDGQSKAL